MFFGRKARKLKRNRYITKTNACLFDQTAKLIQSHIFQTASEKGFHTISLFRMVLVILNIIIWGMIYKLSSAQLQNRMDIPLGVPDLDDRFSKGLANYIGIPALPGASGSFGDPISISGRSGGSASSPANSLSYNDFPSLPGLQNSNRAGMTKWYGPDFQPPAGYRDSGQGGQNMLPPQPAVNPPQPQPPVNDGCKFYPIHFSLKN